MAAHQCEFQPGSADRCLRLTNRQVHGHWACWQHERRIRAYHDICTVQGRIAHENALAACEQVVRAVAHNPPLYRSEAHRYCGFCHRDTQWGADVAEDEHAPDCLWCQAVAVVAALDAAAEREAGG